LHLSPNAEYTEAFVNDDELLVGGTLWIIAVAQPAEAITYLAVPRGVFFPCNFFHILNGVKGKVNAKRDLERLGY
jgi:hypothetical protein